MITSKCIEASNSLQTIAVCATSRARGANAEIFRCGHVLMKLTIYVSKEVTVRNRALQLRAEDSVFNESSAANADNVFFSEDELPQQAKRIEAGKDSYICNELHQMMIILYSTD